MYQESAEDFRPTISLEGVSIGLPQGPYLLRDVSLHILPGERIGIIGANGVGKTTLLRTLLGYQQPVTGQVMLDGRPLESYSPKERATLIGYLPQQYEQLPLLTVKDFFLSLEAQYAVLGTAEKIIDRFSLQKKEMQPLNSLSGGELRRVFIAASIIQSSKVLLCDEPLVSLDDQGRTEVVEALYALSREQANLSMVITSHDIEFIRLFATRLLMIEDGKLQEVAQQGDQLPRFTAHSDTVVARES